MLHERPFCGEKEAISTNFVACTTRHGGYLAYVECEVCGARTKPFYLSDRQDECIGFSVASRRAENAWNRRTSGNG